MKDLNENKKHTSSFSKISENKGDKKPGIHFETIKFLRTDVFVLIKKVELSYRNLGIALKTSDETLLVKVFENSDKINNKFNKLLDDAIFELTKTPLAKDLRRVVSYIIIGEYLDEMGESAKKIAKFALTYIKDNIDFSILSRMSIKIEKRLEILIEIINTEFEDLGKKLLKKDKKIDDLFKELYLNIGKYKLPIKTKLTKKKNNDTLRSGLLISAKKLENTGDSIKQIVAYVFFATTGEHFIIDKLMNDVEE